MDDYTGPVPHDVLIAIVTYNSEQVILDLLASIPGALGGLTAETIIVDNDSRDGTVGLVSGRADCRVVRQANLGYAAGINRAVRELPGPQPVLVLNPDVRLQPDCVRLMYSTLVHTNAGVVSPRVLDERGRLVLSMRREPRVGRALGLNWTGLPGLSEYVTDEPSYSQPGLCDWVLGAVVMVSRRCHEVLGGWDETFFLYSEETDFCLRARDAGWVTRHVPDAVAVHIGAQSGQSARIHAMQVVNRVRLFRRRNPLGRSILYFGAAVLSEFSWLARGRPHSAISIRALLIPRTRPRELNASDRFIPQ